MSLQRQVRSRGALATRGNRPGSDALALFAGVGSAVFDPSFGITLNGTTVSAQQDACRLGAHEFGPWPDIAQGTGAKQPLFTGSAAINGQPTMTFARASAQLLSATNVNAFPYQVGCFVAVAKYNSAPGAEMILMANAPSVFNGLTFGVESAANRHSLWTNGQQKTWGVIDTAAPHIMVIQVPSTVASSASLWIDGVLQAPNGGSSNPINTTATSFFVVGSDGGAGRFVDATVGFIAALPMLNPDLIAKLTRVLGLKFGITVP